MSMARYAPLWCKSNFSFLEGASRPEELVEACHRLDLRHLAVTDRDGMYGVVRAHRKARELGVHLILGSEITVEGAVDGTLGERANGSAEEDGVGRSPLVLLAKHREGYQQLCRLITKGRLRSEKGSSMVRWSEVRDHANGLVALGGLSAVKELRSAFDKKDLYALLPRHRRASDVPREQRLARTARKLGLRLVAANEVLYHSPARRSLQDVLTCIRHRCSLQEIGRRTRANAEHYLHSAVSFERLYRDVPEAVLATEEIAERCTFSLSEIHYRYPSERLPDGSTSSEWLRTLVQRGAHFRYGDQVPAEVSQQIDKELALIDELDYCGYFLTMWEIVEFCRRQSILCQGRGSAANSAVCYCLRITSVDPVRMGLLFERFLSRERAEPPDIDLDIEHDRREEVIQFVYEKYGRSHAAMVANVVCYRPRSAIRDVGKALGLDDTLLDRCAKWMPHWGDIPEGAIARAGFDRDSGALQHLTQLTNEILDFPRHLSIHPGGFLLGHEAVHDLVPLENATMPGRTVIQWDKDDLEELGLFKVDLLGLGALTQLHLAFDLLRQHRGREVTMATVPAEDPETFAMVQKGDTVGVFQIESRAQMSMLPRLRPRTFYDLVIEVSIVRPGPITGGMVHPFLRRRNGEEKIDYPHPSLKPVLEKTLGIPLFQEQVMKLAVVAADYTPGEADQLRRDMAAWKKTGSLEKHHLRLVSRMKEKGIEEEFAERVFQQIRGFGEYGFPESHAASFALIAYATAWLKCHYPEEFVCSLLNAQPMGFYSVATIVEDAKRHEVNVAPLCALESEWDCSLEPTGESGFQVRMGARFVKGLSPTEWQKVDAARERVEKGFAPPFVSVEDFASKTRLTAPALRKLAEAGAFESFQTDRRPAFWKVSGWVPEQDVLPLVSADSTPSFASLAPLETVAWDYRTTSHSPRGHPLEAMREALQEHGLPTARQVNARAHGNRARYAGIVICRQRPGTARGVVFMTLEDETGFVNLVVWQNVFEKYELLAKTATFLGVTGKLQSQDGVVHLVASQLWAPRLGRRLPSGGSRDFH